MAEAAVGLGNTVAAVPASGFFVDQKRGEVNELKTLLKNINVEKDTNKKREIIKKVIAYMTLGIDVSRLFTDMIMAIETKDVVIKKMVYLYLCSYAHKEPDMALMCINTLRRECENEDPMIRGLALRSLCSLRLESIIEYVQQPLQKSLSDVSPYVRKTGVLGVLKLHYMSPSIVESGGYLDTLTRMIQDVDAQVVQNAMFAVHELNLKNGGIPITSALILGLLNRLSEFSEWGLAFILDLVSRYFPTSEEEIFAIMNLLDPLLRTANSSAVLATLKCFLHLTSVPITASDSNSTNGMDLLDLQPSIFSRIRPPLLTFITGGAPEIQFVCLKHLQLLMKRKACFAFMEGDFRTFYIRYHEPFFVKCLKVDLLAQITPLSSANEVLEEIETYLTDLDPNFRTQSFEALVHFARRFPRELGGKLVQVLLGLLQLPVSVDAASSTQSSSFAPHDDEEARSLPWRFQAIYCLKEVIQAAPEAAQSFLPALASLGRPLLEVSAMLNSSSSNSSLGGLSPGDLYACAYPAQLGWLWLLGEWGEDVPQAPYLLEAWIDRYTGKSRKNADGDEDEENDEDENDSRRYTPPEIVLQLLVSSMKLFVKRPVEMQEMTGRLLKFVLEDDMSSLSCSAATPSGGDLSSDGNANNSNNGSGMNGNSWGNSFSSSVASSSASSAASTVSFSSYSQSYSWNVRSSGSRVEVRDRALFYARLLRHAPSAVWKELFPSGKDRLLHPNQFTSSSSSSSSTAASCSPLFAELQENGQLNQVFAELNSLSVLYEVPAIKFVENTYQFNYESPLISDYDPMPPSMSDVATPIISSSSDSHASSSSVSGSVSAPSSSSVVNLLDDWSSSPAPAPAPAPASTSSIMPSFPSSLPLSSQISLSPEDYQRYWLALPDQFNGILLTSRHSPHFSTQEIEALLKMKKIFTMASGPNGNQGGSKYFLYAAEEKGNAYYLGQLILTDQQGHFILKCQGNGNATLFLETLRSSLSSA